MLKIKLSRTGSKNHPAYRLVVLPDRSKLTGSVRDTLGYYLPLSNQLSVDKTKFDYWLSKGAIPTPRVKKLIQSSN